MLGMCAASWTPRSDCLLLCPHGGFISMHCWSWDWRLASGGRHDISGRNMRCMRIELRRSDDSSADSSFGSHRHHVLRLLLPAIAQTGSTVGTERDLVMGGLKAMSGWLEGRIVGAAMVPGWKGSGPEPISACAGGLEDWLNGCDDWLTGTDGWTDGREAGRRSDWWHATMCDTTDGR